MIAINKDIKIWFNLIIKKQMVINKGKQQYLHIDVVEPIIRIKEILVGGREK